MKPYLIIFAIALTGTAAKAQSAFKTNESISSQLRNGTAPGLVYGKAGSVKQGTTAESVNTQSAGKQVNANVSSGAANDKKMARTSSVPLASDKPAEVLRPVAKTEPPKIDQQP